MKSAPFALPSELTETPLRGNGEYISAVESSYRSHGGTWTVGLGRCGSPSIIFFVDFYFPFAVDGGVWGNMSEVWVYKPLKEWVLNRGWVNGVVG